MSENLWAIQLGTDGNGWPIYLSLNAAGDTFVTNNINAASAVMVVCQERGLHPSRVEYPSPTSDKVLFLGDDAVERIDDMREALRRFRDFQAPIVEGEGNEENGEVLTFA